MATAPPVAYRDDKGNVVTLSQQIGQGGEGVVYDVAGQTWEVAKIWHPGTDVRTSECKLQAMSRQPPAPDPQGRYQVVWPQSLLYDRAGAPAGFLMPKLDSARWDKVLKYYTPRAAQELARRRNVVITLELRNRMAFNICYAIHAIHQAGYVIGDINEQNIMATPTGEVAIIDCDAFQVQTAGETFRVAKVRGEFQPPELQGINPQDITRVVNHDAFALGILLFKLLCQGAHPYDGTAPDYTEQAARIKNGIFYPERPSAISVTAEWQSHWDALNTPTQSRFSKTFTTQERTLPLDWLEALANPQRDPAGRQTIGAKAAPPRPTEQPSRNTAATAAAAYRDNQGHAVKMGQPIYQGNAGVIYTVTSQPQNVAKIWHPGANVKTAARKLQAMMQRPPAPDRHGRYQIIWPQQLVYDAKGNPAGFLMERLTTGRWHKVPEYYTPHIAQGLAHWRNVTITLELRNRMALKICHAVHAIHQAGYVVGDINEQNIMATSVGNVAVIDCDAFQVQTSQETFLAATVRPECQPTELRDQAQQNIIRDTNHDAFALGILLFKLLCQGVNPWDGIANWQNHWDALNTATQVQFRKTFTTQERPSPQDWIAALQSPQRDHTGWQTIGPATPAQPSRT